MMIAKALGGIWCACCICAGALAAAASEQCIPQEWASVQTNAIARWKLDNQAPDGVVADVAAHRVRMLAEATGLAPVDTIEFFMIGPLSDRAYESFLVSVASPSAIADAFERAGVPRGQAPDLSSACFWPVGEKITLSARVYGSDASPSAVLGFGDLLDDTLKSEGGDVLQAPFLYTGGARDAQGAVIAATNIPCAVFALYTSAPSLLLMNGQFAQSESYGRFRAKRRWPAGTLFELTFSWDGRTTVLHRDVTLCRTNATEILSSLRSDAVGHDLFARVAFAPDVTVDDAASLSHALALVDGQGVKLQGAAKGQFFFRAFLPNPAWRERAKRIFQPFEVRLAADGAKSFTFVEEDWSGEGLDPVLKPRTAPFAEWAELPGLIARTGEAGAKINVMFLFAPKGMPVATLAPVLSVAAPRIATFYVFAE